MLKNKKMQIRLSEELQEFLQKTTDNASLFIRNLIREKMESGLDNDDLSNAVEIRARSPYIYYAKLFRIVDGDTMFLDFDVGFFTNVKTKIRLAGVNTPPLETPEGEKARDFVEKELSGCSRLVVETRKKEKYGRYLAYIYYHPDYDDFEDIIRYGKSLSDELINQGFGEKYVS